MTCRPDLFLNGISWFHCYFNVINLSCIFCSQNFSAHATNCLGDPKFFLKFLSTQHFDNLFEDFPLVFAISLSILYIIQVLSILELTHYRHHHCQTPIFVFYFHLIILMIVYKGLNEVSLNCNKFLY